MRPDEQRLGSLLADAGTVTWDAAANQLEVDEPAARLFGVHKSAFGSDLLGLLRQVRVDCRDRLAAALEHAVTEGTIFEIEVEVDLPDRSLRMLLLRGAVLDDLEGGPERIVLGVRDITELAAKRANLAATQAKRADQAAAHAREIAVHEAAARDRGELVGGLSREIRTRLGDVLGMSRLLLDGALTPAQREAVATIQAAGDELLAFTADTIDVSADGAPSEPELGVVSIRELVAACATTAREVALDRHVDDAVPHAVRADGGRLARVLSYVLRDAIAASRSRGVVSIAARAVKLRGSLHDLAIEVTSGDVTGPSLGMSVAARLMTRMGGRLVTARDAAGARTTLELSVDATVLDTQPIARPVVEPDPLLAMRHPLRILVAEDNAVNRRVIDAFCARLGYTARHAADGKEALEAATREAFDLIFMDIQMPEVDGLEATRLIRRTPPPVPNARPPRIVALTANALPSDRAACLRAGCDDYIAKPVTLEKLAAAVLACPPAVVVAHDAAALDDKLLGRLEVALGPKLLAEVLGTHAADARELVHGLRGAAERGDAVVLARLAKTLAGSARAVGATALDIAAMKLALTSERGVVVGAREQVDRLARELAQVRVALEPRLNQ